MNVCIICTVGIPEGADMIIKNGNPAHLACYDDPIERGAHAVALSFVDAVREAVKSTLGRSSFEISHHFPADATDAFPEGVPEPEPVSAGITAPGGWCAPAGTVLTPPPIQGVYAAALAEMVEEMPRKRGGITFPSDWVDEPHEALPAADFPANTPSTLSTCRICNEPVYRLNAQAIVWNHTKAMTSNEHVIPAEKVVEHSVPNSATAEPAVGATTHATRQTDCNWCGQHIERDNAGQPWLHMSTYTRHCRPYIEDRPAEAWPIEAYVDKIPADSTMSPMEILDDIMSKGAIVWQETPGPTIVECWACGTRLNGVKHYAEYGRPRCMGCPAWVDAPAVTEPRPVPCARCACVISTSDVVDVAGSLYHRACNPHA